MLTALLAGTAALAGVTGAWSPCGFSMVDTLAAAAREGGRRILPPACAAFTLGTLAGGATLFGGLAAIGALLHTGGDGLAAGAAAAVAGAAALAELAGVRIRPQVRRQVPEEWRRTMPLPLAAGLYGVLLGVGFATFVLTLAVGALAFVCLTSGQPALGLAVGLGFGAGRALPVVLLAPAADSPAGIRALELMAERPTTLRGLRVLDGAALALCALALGTGPAWAGRVASGATDPSASGGGLAWQRPGGSGVLRIGERTVGLPGTDPAIAGPYLALRNGDAVTVYRGSAVVLRRRIPGVGKLAVSRRWLAWRRSDRGGLDVIEAAALRPGAPVGRVATASPASQLGRPELDGNRVVYHVAGRRGSALRMVDLRSGRRTTLARARGDQVLNPTLSGRTLLYVRISRCGQRLVIRRRGRERVLLRGRPLAGIDPGFDPGHTSQGSRRPCPTGARTSRMLWTTALSPRYAYVAVVRLSAGGASNASLMRVRRH